MTCLSLPAFRPSITCPCAQWRLKPFRMCVCVCVFINERKVKLRVCVLTWSQMSSLPLCLWAYKSLSQLMSRPSQFIHACVSVPLSFDGCITQWWQFQLFFTSHIIWLSSPRRVGSLNSQTARHFTTFYFYNCPKFGSVLQFLTSLTIRLS